MLDPQGVPDDSLDALIAATQALLSRTPLDYVPHPPNVDTGFPGMLHFHASFKKIRLLAGGNRSGKTEAGAAEALFHATGLYPSWYPEAQRINRPTRGRVVVGDYAKACGEVLEPKIMSWLPPSLMAKTPRRTLKGFLEKVFVKHVSGGISTFDVMTHEQDDGVFEGWSGDWVWFDEPPPRDKWVACKRGLVDFNGRAWFTMTPIKEFWIYDEFILSADPNVLYLNVDIRDNPHLTEEAITFFESQLSEDEKEARLHGKFQHLSGRVYKELIPEVHLVSQEHVKIDKRWPVWFVLDPADRRPHRGVWAKVDPYNTIYIVDEIEFTGNIEQVSKEILKREISNGINPNTVIRILDPNKGRTPSAFSQEAGITMAGEFANHALYFNTNVNDDVALGHLAVKEKLSWDKRYALSTTNHPKLLFVKENTTKCIKQMLTYVWDDHKGGTKDSKDLKEKPKDLNKDFPDCIRYLVVFDPVYYNDEDDKPNLTFRPTSRTGYR